MKKHVFAAALAFTAVACSPKTTESVEVKKETTSYPSPEIAEGSQLYSDNCGKCHDLPKEKDYSQAQWKAIVPNMAAKAKLSADQENRVMQYVLWKSGN